MTAEEVTIAFQKALSKHGYGFQYAVLAEVEALYAAKRSFFVPWVPEFPVEVQGAGTRIDIVFRHRVHPYYLVCECKRANPATVNWCFARAPRPDLSSYSNRSYVETLLHDGGRVKSRLHDLVGSDRIYQVALEVRSHAKGDESGRVRGEIEEAATQVCRGFNGLIRFFSDNRNALIKPKTQVAFVPVIITTARIFATTADIANTELVSGEVNKLEPALTERDWIWYEYPQSPGLKHDISMGELRSDLRRIFYEEYVRRIAIVTPAGLAAFMGMDVWQYP